MTFYSYFVNLTFCFKDIIGFKYVFYFFINKVECPMQFDVSYPFSPQHFYETKSI